MEVIREQELQHLKVITYELFSRAAFLRTCTVYLWISAWKIPPAGLRAVIRHRSQGAACHMHTLCDERN